jgi:two-component system cell cycle sensor histidine kinase/response regulator CckA
MTQNLLSRRAGLFPLDRAAPLEAVQQEETDRPVPGNGDRVHVGRPTPEEEDCRYRALVDYSSDMMFVVAADGTFEFASPACLRILGYRQEEMIGRSCFEFIHPDDVERMSAKLTVMIQRPGATRTAECRLRTKNGAWRWVETVGTNLLEEPGVHAIVVNSRDVTARKQTEVEREVFFDVIRALNTTPQLNDLLAQIHCSLKRILYAENCFIALYNETTEMFHFPFFVDQFDSAPPPQRVGRNATAYVFRTGRPLLLQKEDLDRLVTEGEIEQSGTSAPAWLGVPLRTPTATIGVLVVQHYADAKVYSERHLELLNSIGGQIAVALERKNVEQTLRNQKREHEIIFESAPAMIWYKDTRNRVLRANRAAAQSLGMEVKDLEGSSMYDLFPSEAVRYHQDDLEVIRTGQPKLGIIQPYRLPSGEVRLVCTDKIPYCAEDGRVTGVVAFSTDITERQRAEEAMRRSEINYRSMVQGAPYGICRVSAQGRLFNANPALVDMLGYSSEAELLETNLDRDVFRETGARLKIEAERGEIYEGVEITWSRKDKLPVRVRLSGRPVRDPEWPSTCYEIVAENITEQRELEKQLRQAQKMEAVGRLAGGVAHDFNNLLMVIQGHTELMLERAREDTWWLNKVEHVRKAAERATGLTRQLLSFSRMQVLQPKVIDLNEIVAEMGKMLPRLIGEDVELRILDGAPPSRVKADPGQLEQVIMNLAVNARDAMPKGGILSIETRSVEVDEFLARRHPPLVPGPYVLLTVSDNGVGMDAETQAHIFEPFFTTKEVGKGTGLGLATVYGVVKQSGGYIWVSSEVGKGTTFQVYLPRAEEQIEGPTVPAVEEERPGGAETILLAEDEKAVREIAREFLSLSGYTVLEAGDGAEALDIASRHQGPIHLLVTDIIMPQLGGRELAERVTELRPEIKVIYMSGYTEYSSLRSSDFAETAVLLSKPFTRSALARTVNEVLKSARVS